MFLVSLQVLPQIGLPNSIHFIKIHAYFIITEIQLYSENLRMTGLLKMHLLHSQMILS